LKTEIKPDMGDMGERGWAPRENVPLAPLTTLGIGGPARYFTAASNESELRQAIAWAKERDLPLFILGGGSNLLVADRGFDGLVIRINVLGINHRHDWEHRVSFDVGAGEEWDAFVAATIAHNCAGIENLSGIPGTVGGTPVQNVGAYGQEVSETIAEVTAYDTQTGQVVTLQNSECGFAYRTSTFNTTEKSRYVVLRVSFSLQHNGTPNLKYADLQKHFAGRNGAPSLQEVREAVRQIRLSKAMLIVPGDEDCRSAGSFFKNPIVSLAQRDEVFAIARRRNIDRVPTTYPAAEGSVKLPAAWLVEQSGFHKGYGKGPAGISRRHTLAIVNRGSAKASDIVALKDEVQRGVKETFGVELHPEPVFLGFETV
jgi:UDP-N-acetylmuramate dehydrogenase